MPKYEVPREDGLKGYVVTIFDWGRVSERTVYAMDAGAAKRKAFGPGRVGAYVKSVRRKPAPEPNDPEHTDGGL